MTPRLVSLIALLTVVSALAQTLNAQSSGPAPVAYVYVSTPLYADGFAVAPNGRLTPLPGSPFLGVALTHMSINTGHLFGSGQDGLNVYSYLIGNNGSLAPIDAVLARGYDDCAKLTSTQIDRTGSTLYLSQSGCSDSPDGNYYNIQSYKIAGDGRLQFLGNGPLDMNSEATPSALYFLANNKHAYQFSCIFSPQFEGIIAAYQRESSGSLDFANVLFNYPDFESAYCLNFLATDDFNNAAIEMLSYDWTPEGYVFNQAKIASFSADSKGDLTTTNGFNVRTLSLQDGQVTAMSISPSGQILAVGGPHGFQLFHFNGAEPLGYYSSVLQPNNQFEEFGWDKSNHLFAVSTDGLRVYNITPTGYSEAPGSPIPIPNASSVIAVPLE